MSHTPGPWFVSADRIASDHGDIAAVHYQSSREQKGWHCADDARLVAAAPELLTALKGLIPWNIDGDPPPQGWGAWADAAAAIAKAEGRSGNNAVS